jgi:arylsulfatase A
MPSRAAFQAGRSPAALNMTFVPEGARDGIPTGSVVPPTPLVDLPTDIPTVASLLGGAGYATAHFGKWHASKNVDPEVYGYDESDGPTANRGPLDEDHPNPSQAFLITERGADFMARSVAADQPFFLQISHYGGTDQLDSLPATYAEVSARLPGEDVKTLADAAVIADMDTTIGSLLDTVETLGIADNTYVLFTSDHGRAGQNANRPLFQGKGSVWEGGIRVPLIVAGPGIAAGVHSHVRASQVDLLPTIIELAGVSAPADGLEGGSLWPVFSGASTSVERVRDEFVVHFPHYDKDPLGPATAILVGDYKLIHFYEDGSYRLYDLVSDLDEQNDLSLLQPERVATMRATLDAYLTAVGAQMPVVP